MSEERGVYFIDDLTEPRSPFPTRALDILGGDYHRPPRHPYRESSYGRRLRVRGLKDGQTPRATTKPEAVR